MAASRCHMTGFLWPQCFPGIPNAMPQMQCARTKILMHNMEMPRLRNFMVLLIFRRNEMQVGIDIKDLYVK